MSRNTDLLANLKYQLSDKACAFDFYSTICHESTDATDTGILLVAYFTY